ncbi:MAG: hypothetical protein A3K19_05945 [Lentisphaerae bacterium RIFOXYB12_FULL_65_16]|nr:MAG: hypothetical protein A3K18_34545 [Lentisphaerae bacterium RIFOXYA12_64_32]OGV94014.1 MAG: hypothetical protein A3K19_05945 [Lentisphaerae bacterium RIFOXYB12_FULL_65_16]
MANSAVAQPASGVPDKDKRILRELGKRKAEIAALPIQQERRELWRRLNQLDSVRPMVYVMGSETPWNEMDVNDELVLRCESQWGRNLETALRRELYKWDHMQGDMVMDPAIEVLPPVRDTGFGIGEKVDVARTDAANDVVSRHFQIQIKDEGDIEKIRVPELTFEPADWDRSVAQYREVFDNAIQVEKRGIWMTSIAPWDFLVRLTGVEEVLLDMCERPAYVHRLMDWTTNAYLRRLDQWEELNVLSLNNDHRLGGGPQYTNELPPPDFNPGKVRTQDMWGRTMSQIFSAVSPAMHEEFALQYECRWLHRFGLTYYGCCEPLDRKVEILRKNVPNLRKISMSPWVDLDLAAKNVGTDYVFSYKHSPAVLAEDKWDPAIVRRSLQQDLKRLRGLHVEIIMKDISTVRYEPKRLWDWAQIAREVAEQCA